MFVTKSILIVNTNSNKAITGRVCVSSGRKRKCKLIIISIAASEKTQLEHASSKKIVNLIRDISGRVACCKF